MKQKLLVLALLVSVLTAAPQKSEAGIILNIWSKVKTAPIFYLGDASLATAIVGTVVFNLNDSLAEKLFYAGLGLIVLDTKIDSENDSLTDAFQSHYRFIEDRAILENLNEAAHQKLEAAPIKDGFKYIQFSREEVLALLAPMDLTGHEQEVEKMITELSN